MKKVIATVVLASISLSLLGGIGYKIHHDKIDIDGEVVTESICERRAVVAYEIFKMRDEGFHKFNVAKQIDDMPDNGTSRAYFQMYNEQAHSVSKDMPPQGAYYAVKKSCMAMVK